jgi:hypothetical protein
MTWPLAKLDLINQNLAITGNNLVAVADDGSDEWTVCSAAYEIAVEYMLENHDWKQITTVAVLQPALNAPSDDQFDTAFNKPADCIHVIWVRLNDQPIEYQILNNQIVINQFGQQPPIVTSGTIPTTYTVPTNATPGTVTMKYVSSSPPGVNLTGASSATATSAISQMTRTFMTALGRFVMAGIYRGLHEDLSAAAKEEQAAVELLREARARSDQEQPKRAPFNSRMIASRRVRRPYPATPTGWGGTGVPG